MKLSKNFTLEEFLRSQTAARHNIDMTPSPEILENIQELVDTCLQPLRDAVQASVNVSSGFRPEELNRRIGGSRTSAHRLGRAADFTITGLTPLETSRRILELDLPYDQVIHEFGQWVHLGIADTLRRQELTAYKHEGKTIYVNGLIAMEDLQ